MNLSHKLTFSLILMLLLTAFVSMPIMAQAVTTGTITTVAVYQRTISYAAGPPVVPGKIVFTFVYSEEPDPRPDLSYFTAPDNTFGASPGDADNTDRDVLSGSYTLVSDTATPQQVYTAAMGGTGKIVTLTLTASTTNTAGIVIPVGLTLKGYSLLLSGTIEPAVVTDGVPTAPASPTPPRNRNSNIHH